LCSWLECLANGRLEFSWFDTPEEKLAGIIFRNLWRHAPDTSSINFVSWAALAYSSKGWEANSKYSSMERKNRVNRNYNIVILLLALLILFLGLNYRQLVSAWILHTETQQLARLAAKTSNEFQNPGPVEDHFEKELSPQFWKFTTINGGERVSNDPAWHAAVMIIQQGLSIQHFPDPEFKEEDSDLTRQPAAGR
jgi:hypothetical protein